MPTRPIPEETRVHGSVRFQWVGVSKSRNLLVSKFLLFASTILFTFLIFLSTVSQDSPRKSLALARHDSVELTHNVRRDSLQFGVSLDMMFFRMCSCLVIGPRMSLFLLHQVCSSCAAPGFQYMRPIFQDSDAQMSSGRL